MLNYAICLDCGKRSSKECLAKNQSECPLFGQPTTRKALQACETIRGATKLPSNLKILVVDDNPLDLHAIKEHLAAGYSANCELLEADGFHSAINRLENHEIDICVTDFMFENGTTGLDLYRAAEARDLTIPFIGVTACASEDILAGMLLVVGFEDVVMKHDLTQANLDRVIRNTWLRGQHAKHLHRISVTDELTGLLNRRGVLMRLQEESARFEREQSILTILYADLDGLKQINDQYGHLEGDCAIQYFALAIGDLLRPTDFFGRIGGDEFIIGLVGMSEDAAQAIVHRIERELAANPIRFQGKPWTLSASIGIFRHSTGEGPDVRAWLQKADKDMYMKKQQSRRGLSPPSSRECSR